MRDPANPWVSEDGQGNSCFTLTEAGELYVLRGQFGPAHPGPLSRDHNATPSPEWLRDAVIYELSARAVGGLSRVCKRLPDLHELGATTLWLMPIQPVGLLNRSDSLGDPYAVRDFLAVDPNLGTPEDLRALVDEAHAWGCASSSAGPSTAAASTARSPSSTPNGSSATHPAGRPTTCRAAPPSPASTLTNRGCATTCSTRCSTG